MTRKNNSGNGGRPLAAEVAIVGAGPVGLMTANLLGLAGIRVLVLERNAGLLGRARSPMTRRRCACSVRWASSTTSRRASFRTRTSAI